MPELLDVTVRHSVTMSKESPIVHNSKVCKNCLSEMLEVPGNPLDSSETNFKCHTCGTEEKVYS